MCHRSPADGLARCVLATLTLLGGITVSGCSRDGVAESSNGPAPPEQAVAVAADVRTAESAATGSPTPAQRPANRLAGETSPYLLAHADNPVDWYPWGPEAFRRARQQNKPIFLSIGYSTCHWCHVMERLVFSNPEIAEFLNRHFVCIKVDREERPDVDDTYMTALQVYFRSAGIPGSGGWPLSMFLTPQGEPILGGTYFPPEDQPGQPGFLTVARRVARAWHDREADLRRDARAIVAQLQRIGRPRLALRPVVLRPELVRSGLGELAETFDTRFGGVGFDPQYPDAPKFPLPVKLRALLLYADRANQPAMLARVRHTLTQIALGGIRDHLGGGFHRYSTDRRWHVPHFEKMLYDNALLLEVYAEAYRITREPLFAEVARDTAEWLLREMRDARGGFYSAMDAESEDGEGAYYVWQPQEIERVLPAEDARLFLRAYGLLEPQRFEGGYVLHLTDVPERLAEEAGLAPEQWKRRMAAARATLLQRRGRRPRPRVDDKILADWNGLAIAALARAGRLLQRPEWVEAGAAAARFVLQHMTDEQGRLWHSRRAGRARVAGFLDDYANLVDGLIALHRATGDSRWLHAAGILTDVQVAEFGDPAGGFFFVAKRVRGEEAATQAAGTPLVRFVDGTPVLAVSKPVYDSVVPAGNATTVRNLVALARLTGASRYRRLAERTLRAFAPYLSETPTGVAGLLLALDEFLANGTADGGIAGASSEAAAGSEDVASNRGAVRPAAETEPAGAPQEHRPTEDAPQFVPAAIAPDPDAVPAQTSSARKEDPPKVTAELYLPADGLPADRLCPFVVHLNVASGWHINANPAHPEFLKPTRLTVTSDLGTQLESVQYPQGQPLRVAGIDQPLQVYAGHVILRGMLRIPPRRGKTETLTITVHYQACNDGRCLRPTRLDLTVRLPVKDVKELRLLNQPLFQPGPAQK